MIQKLRTIALGTVAIAAVIVLFATGPVVATHQAQAACNNPLCREVLLKHPKTPKDSFDHPHDIPRLGNSPLRPADAFVACNQIFLIPMLKSN